MKKQNFGTTSLTLYNKSLMEELEKDMHESGIHSKNQYLTHLIELGLQARKNNRPEKQNLDTIGQELKEIKKIVSDLQCRVLREQLENTVYKSLLCYLYYLLECIIYEREPNESWAKLGLCDELPDHLNERLKELREVYDIA